MSHSAPPSPARRKIEYVLGVLALVIALPLLGLAFVALSHPHGRQASHATAIPTDSSDQPSATPSTSTTPSATKSAGTSASTSKTPSAPATTTASARPAVIVLDNTSTSELTATAVSRLQSGGWQASNGGTFDGDILSTAVYYDPSVSGAQQAAIALQAQFPAIKRVKEKFDGLPEGPLVLVLTSDYS